LLTAEMYIRQAVLLLPHFGVNTGSSKSRSFSSSRGRRTEAAAAKAQQCQHHF